MSPSTNFLLPGSTMSRVPPSRRKRGSSIPSSGIATSPPSRTSLMSRSCDDFLTAPRTSALARRKNRCRFSKLLPPGFRRRSTMCVTTATSASTGLLYPHVPFDQPADLALGIPALHHPRDEVVVLLLGGRRIIQKKRNDRQQVLDLREYTFFDHFADFFVGGPARILAAMLGSRPQREFHHLVAEILRIGDPR